MFNIILFQKKFDILLRNLPLILQIRLVTQHYQPHLVMGVSFDLAQPLLQIDE